MKPADANLHPSIQSSRFAGNPEAIGILDLGRELIASLPPGAVGSPNTHVKRQEVVAEVHEALEDGELVVAGIDRRPRLQRVPQCPAVSHYFEFVGRGCLHDELAALVEVMPHW